MLTFFVLISAGEGRTNSPIEYDQLLQLHTNCEKALKDGAAKPSHNVDIDTGLFVLFVKFQALYKARVDYFDSWTV